MSLIGSVDMFRVSIGPMFHICDEYVSSLTTVHFQTKVFTKALGAWSEQYILLMKAGNQGELFMKMIEIIFKTYATPVPFNWAIIANLFGTYFNPSRLFVFVLSWSDEETFI